MTDKRPPVDAADDPPPKVTRRIAAEAATWVARLHGPNRDRQMELACLAWQARSAAHRHAFERCTEVWLEVPNAARAAGYVPTRRPPGGSAWAGPRRPRWMAMAASCVLLLAVSVMGWLWWGEESEYRTAVGEAQTVVLADGTRMFLNTDTRVAVALDSTQRRVSVRSGEVAFEVAKDPARPFVVRAAANEVVALGTVFAVRLTPAAAAAGEARGATQGVTQGVTLVVTLLEGKVALRSVAGSDGTAAPVAQALVMQPGERVRVARASGRAAVTRELLDRPRLDQVTAWRRNEVVFDRTSLSEAVAEMNRYSRVPLVLMGDLAQSDRLVSGQYRTGDNAGFAHALAALHGLVVHERQDRLELSKGP
jgi:transmembrane sensor